MLKVNMIVKFVAVGVSFRQARRLYQTVKEETGMGVLGNITDKEVSNICRTICAINLQSMKELLKDCWAFSIGLDGGNNAGSAYLDIRMRCGAITKTTFTTSTYWPFQCVNVIQVSINLILWSLLWMFSPLTGGTN
jgi:hypothetical protein